MQLHNMVPKSTKVNSLTEGERTAAPNHRVAVRSTDWNCCQPEVTT